jgi:hypothetical protein
MYLYQMFYLQMEIPLNIISNNLIIPKIKKDNKTHYATQQPHTGFSLHSNHPANTLIEKH